MKSDKALFVILTTVTLDAAGIGLIMPVLPGLLRAGGADQVARHYGVLLALYALMQFLCAPLLGALSDATDAVRCCWPRWPAPRWTTR